MSHDPLSTIRKTIQAHHYQEQRESEQARRNKPFVTIAREAGAGGRTLAEALARKLAERETDSDRPWLVYDRELVQKVADDHHIAGTLVESLEDQQHHSLKELFKQLTNEAPATLTLVKKVSETMLGLAKKGRVVLVGRGGVFITRNLPGGVHVFLTAPKEDRIKHLASEWGLSDDQARDKVHELDRNRADFYRRYFPRFRAEPGAFDLVLETSKTPLDEQVAAVIEKLDAKAETLA